MAAMPIIRPCSDPGCATLTMGELCLAHEHARLAEQPLRRRAIPYVALVAAAAGLLAAFAARARVPV
jgi:hypothetical protein